MKTSIRIAALLLGGAMFIGCDKKDSATVTTPDGTTTTTTVTAPAAPTAPAMPAAPDTSKMGSAINNAVDKGADATKTEADKLMGKMPTTAPSMPAMPH